MEIEVKEVTNDNTEIHITVEGRTVMIDLYNSESKKDVVSRLMQAALELLD